MRKNSKIVVALAVIVPSFLIAYQAVRARPAYVERAKYLNDGRDVFPDPWLLVYAGMGSFLVLRVRDKTESAFKRIGRSVLSKRKAEDSDRVERFASVLFKSLFFVIASIAGYFILKDEDFLPPQLLGAGVVSNAIVGWPLHRMSTKLKMYYLCAFAYHGHSLIALTRPKSLIRNDFFEMAIHHTATLLLMSMSWLLNWVRVGSLVLFVHDVSDIFTYGIKVTVDTDAKKLTYALFAGVLVSWAWLRLYVLPAIIIRSVLELTPALMGEFAAYSFAALLSTLVILHCYWYILIVKMGFSAARTGKTEDTYQRKNGKRI